MDKGDLVLFQLASNALVPHVTPWFQALSREQVRVSVSHPPVTERCLTKSSVFNFCPGIFY